MELRLTVEYLQELIDMYKEKQKDLTCDGHYPDDNPEVDSIVLEFPKKENVNNEDISSVHADIRLSFGCYEELFINV